jgi:hypothetical protein
MRHVASNLDSSNTNGPLLDHERLDVYRLAENVERSGRTEKDEVRWAVS